MNQPKRVLCIMDFSLVGRAGLAVAAPVLSACGVQACGLPSALFSTHTGGFGLPARVSQAAYGREALAHFARQDITFDAVYTGYLYGEDQFALAEAAFAQYPDAFHLVDPAMADDGKLYSGLDAETAVWMRQLADKARLITPNYTESALLCGEPPSTQPSGEQAILERLRRLSEPNRSVLITSVPTADGWQIAGCGPNGSDAFLLPSRQVPQHYPGTGDGFTAAVCGLLLQNGGMPLQTAATRAAAFVEQAAAATWAQRGEARHGLWFEPFLPRLAPLADDDPDQR